MRGYSASRAGYVLMAALLASTTITPINMAQAQQASSQFSFDIPAKSVTRAVNDIGRVAGLSVVFREAAPITAIGRPVQGTMSAEDALSSLLAGTGLTYRFSNPTTVQIYDPNLVAQGDLSLDTGEATLLGTVIIQSKLAYSGAINGYLAPATETGVKAGAPLSEVPQSISVVTTTELDARKPRQIEDAVKYTAGINASTWGTDDRFDQFAIRGFDLGTQALYRDGLPQKSISFTAFTTDPYMIERIDVLRGPAGVLYGSNDAGGMINLVTKRPTFDRLAEGKLGYDSNGTAQVGIDWSNTINADGTVAARLTGLARAGETDIENSNNDRAFLAGGLTWSPTDYTALTFLGHIQRDSLTPLIMYSQPGVDYDTAWGTMPDDWAYKQSDYNHFKTRQESFGWEFTHEFSTELTFNQRARFAHQTTDYTQFDISYADAAGLYYYPFRMDEEARTIGLDNFLEWKRGFDGGENSLILGAEYQRRTLREYVYMDGVTTLVPYGSTDLDMPVTEPPLSAQDRKTYTERGIYLQDHLKLDAGTSLTFGLRRAWLEDEVVDLLAGGVSRQKNSATTGMIGLTHEFSNGLTPYLSYTQGFIQNVGTTIAGKVLDPSESKQWEAGLRYAPTEALLLSGAIFDLRKTNVKDYDLNDPTWGSFTQAGEIRSRGIELEARGQLTETLQGMISYTYLNTEITKSSDASLVGNQNAMAPKRQASLWLDYDASALLPGLTIGGGVRYVSDSYATQANLRKTPGYTLADLSLRYDAESYAVDFGVTNLFDRDYNGVCYDGYACAKGEGRIVSLTLNKSF